MPSLAALTGSDQLYAVHGTDGYMIRTLLLAGLIAAPQGNGSSAGSAVGAGPGGEMPGSVLLLPEGSHTIVVEKATQTLILYRGTPEGIPQQFFFTRTNTGEREGDKQLEGDLRTPEGIYFFGRTIDGRELPAEYGKRAFTTDFPNVFDQLTGKRGSNIWLHATDDPERVYNGWNTRGCVVVTNEDIDLLTLAIRMGPRAYSTAMVVEEHRRTFSPEEAAALRGGMIELIDNWKGAWESRDTDRYMGFYDPLFSGLGRNFRTHSAYKDRLNRQYSFIEVDISNLHVYTHDGELVAAFDQDYRSDYYQAKSAKRLYFSQQPEGWRIVRETGYIFSEEKGVFEPSRPAQAEKPAEPVIEPVTEPDTERVAVPETETTSAPPTAEVRALIGEWEGAWESRDTDRYMTFYSTAFRGMGRDYQGHRAHKDRLARLYSFIRVEVRNLRISSEGELVVAEFDQIYESDMYREESTKQLYFRYENSSWKIVREESGTEH